MMIDAKTWGIEMASADYWVCDVCDCKAFYDANLNYSDDHSQRRRDGRMLPAGCGDAQVLCVECAKTMEVVIRTK